MDVLCTRIELKQDSLDDVRAWARELKSRPDEVVATLAAEGVVIESVFLDRIGTLDYLVFYMRAADMKKALHVGPKLTASIQAYHNAFKVKTWAKITPLECLVDFTWDPAATSPAPGSEP